MIRNLAQVDAGGFEILGEPTIQAEAVLANLRTQGFAAVATELTTATGHVETHRHPVARHKPPHLASHLGHLTRYLVAHDQGQNIQSHPTGAYFQISAADAHVAHPHQRLVRAYTRGRHILQDKRTAELL